MLTTPEKRAFFDRWAPHYDILLPSVFYQAVHMRLLDSVQLPAPATVLDVGCGTGKLLQRLAVNFPTLRGTGVDYSAAMLRQAQQKSRYRDRLQFLKADVVSLPLADATCDGVFCAISFLHYAEPEQALRSIRRVLKPGGRFFLADFTPLRWVSVEPVVTHVVPGGVRFYSAEARAALGQAAGLRCERHAYLLGPVLLSQFVRHD
ncbi:MAG: methyltransferase domain-containing protein [Cyanobacteria bacterium J06626_4]